MKGSIIFRKINKDRLYLLKSYALDMLVMLVLIALLSVTGISIGFEYSHWYLLIIPFAMMNGLVLASLLHNTSHNNIKNDFLNRVVGEYCGYWVLYGFENFVLVHFLHHKYSDEELDPVNPKGMSFIVFLSAPMRYMIDATRKYLMKIHGSTENYSFIMKTQTLAFHINIILRLVIWYMLLGKTLFFTFYIPGVLSIVAIFAHINYNCHQEKEDGSIEIVNLNHNLYYKIANFFTVGGYFHLNHHQNVNLFDPRFQGQSHSTFGLQAHLSNIFRKLSI